MPKSSKVLLGIVLLFLISGCGSNALLQKVTPVNTSLSKYKYAIISVEGKNELIKKEKGFGITQKELKNNFISNLSEQNKFKHVSGESSGNHEKETLFIKLVIEELSYLSGASSYFFGIFSGNASLKVLARLIDVKTNKTIGEIRSFSKTSLSGGIFRGGTATLIREISEKLVEDITNY